MFFGFDIFHKINQLLIRDHTCAVFSNFQFNQHFIRSGTIFKYLLNLVNLETIVNATADCNLFMQFQKSFIFGDSDNLIGNQNIRNSLLCHHFRFTDFCHSNSTGACIHLFFRKIRHFVSFRMWSEFYAHFICICLHIPDIFFRSVQINQQGRSINSFIWCHNLPPHTFHNQ